MTKKNWFKRRFLVDPKAQLVFLAYSLFLAILLQFIVFVCKFIFPEGQDLSFISFNSNNVIIIFAIFLLFIAAITLSLVISNKVVGPIGRMQQHMEKIIQGKTASELKFRESDHFTELAKTYNDLIAHYEKKNLNKS